jgi:tetratricopeptide (TPR) repeat protein
MGDLARSIQYQLLGAKAAERAAHPTRELTIKANLGLLYINLGQYAEARITLEAQIELAEILGDRWLKASLRRHLGYVYWRIDNVQLSLEQLEQALIDLVEIGDIYGQAACHAYLGYIGADTENWKSAAEHLAKARSYFEEMGIDPDKFEAQAFEALCLLTLGQKDDAHALTVDVWDYIRTHGAEEMDSPARVFLSLADVFNTVKTPGISVRDVIEMGYRDLMQRAEKISDIEWQQSFLENVVENRVIIERYNDR